MVGAQNNFNGQKPSFKRLDKLEALRGFVAIYVLLHHVMPREFYIAGLNAMMLFRFGQEGVILFFLLSGFVIHYSCYFSRKNTFKSYFKRRFLRIYVPLVFVLALGFLLNSYQAGRLINPQWLDLVGNLLMLQDWSWAKPGVLVDTYLGNQPLWSLSYEWWFYMLYWPLSRLFISNPNKAKYVHLLVAGATIGATIVYCFAPNFFVRLVIYFMIWWSGVILADAFIHKQFHAVKTLLLSVVPLILITVILSASAFNYINLGNDILLGKHPMLEPRHTGFAAIAIVTAFLWHRYNFIGFNALIGIGILIAPISYSLYISHWVLLVDAQYFSFISNPILEYALYALVTVIFCWLVECVVYPMVKKKYD